MFLLTFFIGFYAYSIFMLGLFGVLIKTNIVWVTIIWSIMFLFFERSSLSAFIRSLKRKQFFAQKYYGSPIIFLLIILFLQIVTNLIGALGPELAFDALWYHLTFPKLYLLHHAIYHIPGGLLYYSDMPKLGELLFVGGMAFGGEIIAKCIHFSFGILTAIALYKLSRRFFTPFFSLLAVVIFYSNLVVDWESITGYIDLIRAFFEVMALWSFVIWHESQKRTYLIGAGFLTGLAIATKVLAIGSLLIFFILLTVTVISKRDLIRNYIFDVLIYIGCSLLVPLPWFIFSYIHTGTPFYPFFTEIYPITPSQLSFNRFFIDLWNLFIRSSDPISPLYLMLLPLLFVTFSKFHKELKLIVWYCALSLLVWYFTPQTGGGRFIVAYLPAFSLVCVAILSKVESNKFIKYLISMIVFICIISIGYRFVANIKYLPFLLGHETKYAFLTKYLNFSYGDFYDTDRYFQKHILSADTVLLYGFHNLYYIDFPFIDSSWVKKGDEFDYLAIQNAVLPTRFHDWQLVYKNDKTMVQLYKPPKGECQRVCVY